MGNIIIVLIILALVCLAIRRIYTTIRYGGSCCGSGSVLDKKTPVKDRNRSHYPFSYRLKVDGMVCAGCARKVENAINSDEGHWARVDLEHKEVYVLSKKKMDRDGFRRLLDGTTYTLLELV